MKVWLFVLWLGAAATVQAQVIIDGFETPSTNWVSAGNQYDGGSLTETALAAHRGSVGLRSLEVPRVGPDGGAWFASGFYRARTLQLSSSTLFARFWFRGAITGTGRSVLAGANYLLDGGGTSTAFSWSAASNLSFVVGTVLLDGGTPALATVLPDAGVTTGWHLHEITQNGVGANGRLLAAIDGRLIADLPTLSVGGIGFRELQLGPTFISGAVASTFDFDDVMIDSVALPSRLRVGVDAGARSGCVELTASLANTFEPDASVPAPYRMDLEVAGVSTFADETCAQPTGWSLPQSERTTRAFVLLDAGLQTIVVRQVPPEDVLPTNVTINVTLSAAGGGGTGGGAAAGGSAGGGSAGGGSAGGGSAGSSAGGGSAGGGSAGGGSAGGGSAAGGSAGGGSAGGLTPDERGPYYQCGVAPWWPVGLLAAVLLRRRRSR